VKHLAEIESRESLLLQVETQIAAARAALLKALGGIKANDASAIAPAADHDPKALAAIARRLIVERRTRDRLFDTFGLFGEPAWDILLDLFVAHADQKPISISSACISSTAPATTGLRYLKALETKQLIERVRHQSDGRVVYVQLTQSALTQMTHLLKRYASDRLTQRILYAGV
jgi:hypothetical protein